VSVDSIHDIGSPRTPEGGLELAETGAVAGGVEATETGTTVDGGVTGDGDRIGCAEATSNAGLLGFSDGADPGAAHDAANQTTTHSANRLTGRVVIRVLHPASRTRRHAKLSKITT